MTADYVFFGHGRRGVPFWVITDAFQAQLAGEHLILFHGESMILWEWMCVAGVMSDEHRGINYGMC